MRIFGRMLAFSATATGVFVAGNFALLLREVLRDPEAWDGGRGVDAFYLALGIMGGGALVLALVAIPSFIGVFAGAVSRGTAAWFLTVPGVFGLVAAAGATGALIALQPAGVEFLVPVVAPMAVAPLLALIAGLLMRASVRPAPPPPWQQPPGPPPWQQWPGQMPGQAPPQQWSGQQWPGQMPGQAPPQAPPPPVYPPQPYVPEPPPWQQPPASPPGPPPWEQPPAPPPPWRPPPQ